MTTINDFLTTLGLSEGEIRVYLATLAIGESFARDIAKKAKVSRTLVYHLLHDLEVKGLVSAVGGAHKRIYSAATSEQLQQLIDRKRAEADALGEQLTEINAQLHTLAAPAVSQARVRFYEGNEGMKTVAQDILDAKRKKVAAFVPIDNVFQSFDETFLRAWSHTREHRQLESRAIWSENKLQPHIKSHFRDLRLAPQDFKFPATVVVYDDNVAIFSSPKQTFALVVESADFADTMLALFEQVWKLSAPVR